MKKENKKVKEKNISNNMLATMIKRGFDNTATKQQFESLEHMVGIMETDLKEVKGDVKKIKIDVSDLIIGQEKLETRIDFIENVLNIPKK